MLQAVRTRVVPWVVWLGTIAAVVSLERQIAEESAIGFAVAVEYQVAPIEAGLVASVTVAVGQRVRAGEVVARLDARAIEAEREVLAAERARLAAEIEAVAAQTSLRVGETTREFAEAIAAAERALTAARGDRKARAAELRALSSRIHALRELVDRRMADRRELDALLVEQARLEQEVRRAEGLVQQLAGEVAAARARQALLPPGTTEAAVRPIRAALAVLAGQAELLALRLEETELRAPVDGVVAQVLLRAGEYVEAGAPVLTIVGDDIGPTPEVQVCVPEHAAAAIRVGDAAVLRPRGGDEGPLAGHVTRMGPTIAELPLRCRRDPEVPEYGREVIVTLDAPARLVPGQALGVAFPRSGAHARATTGATGAGARAERGKHEEGSAADSATGGKPRADAPMTAMSGATVGAGARRGDDGDDATGGTAGASARRGEGEGDVMSAGAPMTAKGGATVRAGEGAPQGV
ncbi:MAG TPA: HlyD family efflux transporter periplasmic adaptor subunit, partial [Nannocystis sp.]